jgi:hypothetical protein
MDTTLKIAVVAALAAMGGGLITGVVAPHITWGIEKRRAKLKYRSDIVQKCRQMIEAPGFSKQSFRITPEYRYLKPYLSEQNIDNMENDRMIMVPKDGDGPLSPYRNILIDALVKLERDWKLI